MFELKIATNFAAAHQLKMVSKKCENLHGHNWKIEVYIKGNKLNDAGVLIDFGELKKHINLITEKLDHKFLNDLDFFNDSNPPSSEIIARFIAKELEASLIHPSVKVSRVTVWESDDACATFIPD